MATPERTGTDERARRRAEQHFPQLYGQKALVLVSHYPFYNLYAQFLQQVRVYTILKCVSNPGSSSLRCVILQCASVCHAPACVLCSSAHVMLQPPCHAPAYVFVMLQRACVACLGVGTPRSPFPSRASQQICRFFSRRIAESPLSPAVSSPAAVFMLVL